MVDISFEVGLVQVIVGTMTVVVTGVVFFAYRKLKEVAKAFTLQGKHIELLEKNLRVLIYVLGERDPEFKDAWNRFAKAESGVPLIDDNNHLVHIAPP